VDLTLESHPLPAKNGFQVSCHITAGERAYGVVLTLIYRQHPRLLPEIMLAENPNPFDVKKRLQRKWWGVDGVVELAIYT
jgi:hypothetical protein